MSRTDSARVTFTLGRQLLEKIKSFKKSLTKKDEITRDQLRKPISPGKDILGADGQPTGLKTTKGMTDAVNEQSRKQNRQLVEETTAHNTRVTGNRIKTGVAVTGVVAGSRALLSDGDAPKNVVPERKSVQTTKQAVPKLKDTTVFVNWRDRPYSIDNSRSPGTKTKRKILPF